MRTTKTFSIGRLDAFVNATPDRYVPLSDEALRLAAELWAKSRQEGQPTAGAKALDVDVILAAQSGYRDRDDEPRIISHLLSPPGPGTKSSPNNFEDLKYSVRVLCD